MSIKKCVLPTFAPDKSIDIQIDELHKNVADKILEYSNDGVPRFVEVSNKKDNHINQVIFNFVNYTLLGMTAEEAFDKAEVYTYMYAKEHKQLTPEQISSMKKRWSYKLLKLPSVVEYRKLFSAMQIEYLSLHNKDVIIKYAYDNYQTLVKLATDKQSARWKEALESLKILIQLLGHDLPTENKETNNQNIQINFFGDDNKNQQLQNILKNTRPDLFGDIDYEQPDQD